MHSRSLVPQHSIAKVPYSQQRGRRAGKDRVDPVVELKGALGRIGTVIRATSLTREDIEALSDKNDKWKALYAVLSAERALRKRDAASRS